MTLLERYKELGIDFDPQHVSINQAIRVNTLKITEENLITRLSKKGVTLTKIPFLEHAYYAQADFSLASTHEYLKGFFYIQETASQLSVQAMFHGSSQEQLEQASVVDLCAAPGSKTTQIAQLKHDKGLVVALDYNQPRLTILGYNLERMGISCVVSYRKEAQFADDLHQQFDYVLLDAPCSGNFCVEEDFFTKRTVTDVKEKAITQKELLKTAVKLVKSGGILVYSTCSLEPEEDELTVNWLLDRYEDFSLVETGISIGDDGFTSIFGEQLHPSLSLAKRLWPHKTNTQGFFIAKLKKN